MDADATHLNEHEEKLTLAVDVWLPNHAPRKASARYAASHHHLVTVMGLGCYICGTRADLETHHRLEWCEAEGLDWGKVRADYPNSAWDSFGHPSEWIDTPENLIVLCSAHHRLRNTGIHNLPHPLWLVQRYRCPEK